MNSPRTLVEGWPALMTAEMAARYTSLDSGTFERVTARYAAHPVDLDEETIRWRKSDLDQLIRRLATKPAFLVANSPSRLGRLDDAEIDRIANAVARRLEGMAPSGQRALVSIKEGSSLLGVSRSTIYRLINEGELSTRQIGRRTLIPMNEIQAILDRA